MALLSGYYNSLNGDRKYNAETMAKYFTGLFTRGVLQNYNGKFLVTALNEGMKISVKTGKAFFSDGKWIENTVDITLTLDPSDVLLDRIDRVVLRNDKNEGVRNADVVIKKGTPGVNPVAPELLNDTYIEELCLCEIRVNKLAETVTQSNITNTIPNKDLCGYITGLIDQVDIKDLYIQYETAYKEFYEDSNKKFNSWFNNVKETLNIAVPFQQFKTCYTTVTENESVFNINIPQLNSVLDILEVYVNGFRLNQEEYTVNELKKVTLAKPLDVIGTKVEFVVFKNTDSEGTKRSTTVTLLTAQWNLLTDNYYQNVTVEGVTANSILIISPAPLSVENYGSFSVIALEQSNNIIRFRAKTRPTVNLDVQILNLGE